MTAAEESMGAEFDDPPGDPLELLRRWWDAVLEAQAPGATAMSLATVGADGTPSVRFVAMADIGADGVCFSTDDRSPKAQELAQNPHVALAGHWEATGQQYRIKGVAEPLPDAESERLFAALPRSAQAALLVAEQSATLDSHEALVHRAASLSAEQGPLRRPAHWRSWLVRAQQVQFWAEDPLDVHRRLAYIRTTAGWSVRRLQP
ncbi:MAG TPA: pyridoxal 5'-phosphate synthase [Beutenbergiaceae bacterium]|nr:pyridoxal 5'-phosphate synthase [Beutenbergiaceae bacterium]